MFKSGKMASSFMHIRRSSTALHFYQNRQLELYAAKEAKRLTLRQLVYFGRHMNEERLITSANYVRTELPVRIAHRLRDIQSLPYVVVTQEGVAKVYELYWSAFNKFRQYPPIKTVEENNAFCNFLSTLLQEHAPVIPNLSLGLSLSSRYLPPDELDSFMRRMLVSRISRRVLAEHHLALSRSFSNREAQSGGEPHVGIIFTGLNIRRTVEYCTRLLMETRLWCADPLTDDEIPSPPKIEVNGHVDTTFSYIREHLEYIIFELLKNSMRATFVNHKQASPAPAIQVTVVAGENDVAIRISDQGGGLNNSDNAISSPSDLLSFSHVRNAARLENSRLGALRSASQSEDGLRATVAEQLGSLEKARKQESFDTSDAPPQIIHPQMGIGLPMSNIYATYFGGTLQLVSLDGWGTDVYLRLPKLGTNLEGIEL